MCKTSLSRAVCLTLLVVVASTTAMAQELNKLSLSTQMFLDEMAGRISFSAPHKSPVNGTAITDNFVSKRKVVRPIVEPVVLNGVKYISAFVRVTDRKAVSSLEALGVKIECEFLDGKLYTTLIPVDKINDVAAITSVTSVNVGTMCRPLTNAARQYSNVTDVLTYSDKARAAGLPNAFDGSGVLLGVIDSGIDFQHKAFKDKDGNSRIKRAYVVTSSGWYGYSQKDYGEGTSNAITTSQPTTDDTEEDHGTHTSSIAGGSSVILNGSTTTVTDDHAAATYGGMAPGADLFLAGIPLSETYIANAFQKICNYADAKGMPVVISNSWGAGYGPHDGTGEIADIVNQYFGDNHPNHVCLFASSNDAGTGGFHAYGQSSATNPLGTVVEYVSDYTDNFYGTPVIAWGRTKGVELRCKIIILNSSGSKVAESSTITPSANGASVTGLSSYISSGSLRVYSQSQNGKSGLTIETSGNYGMTLKSGYKMAVQVFPASGSTIVDMWSDGYSYFTNKPASSGYTWTAGDDDMSVCDEATIENAISVGAYSTKNKVVDYRNRTQNLNYYTVGDIAYFSSYATPEASPTGIVSPTISAPGATIVSAVNHLDTSGDFSYMNGNSDKYGYYRVNTDTGNPYGSMEGTSMATPAAAGIVALWLQAAKQVGKDLTVNDVKEIMKATAIHDSYTEGVHKANFGGGKIDALAGIKYILGDSELMLGDVNLDGKVDVDDANIIIAIILGKDKAENYDRRAYITDDDTIDVDDVNALIAIILGK